MPGGVLYIVATPIGNLEDVTLRALRVLREVDLIAAEDTRHTRLLLSRHGISGPVTSYYDAVERARAPGIVEKLKAGARVALVSDAGTPGIADPGYHLVRGALAAGVPVVPVPGPSAVTALVSVAGLAAFLAAAHAALGERDAVVARELTKRHEDIMRGTLGELAARVATMERVRGEVTVLVAARGAGEAPVAGIDLDARIRAARAAGRRVAELATEIAAETGVARRVVYKRALELARE